MRSYSTSPQIWGAPDPNCAHEWAHRRYYTEKSASGSSRESFHEAGAANAARLKTARWREDDTCVHCGAWRGELGAEPTVQQYVANLVEVCREVRRVLRPDGLFFLNLGTSYAAKRMESEEYDLRDDLTAEERAYVLEELASHYRSKAKETVP